MKKNVHPFVPSYFDSLNSDKISSYYLKKNKKKTEKPLSLLRQIIYIHFVQNYCHMSQKSVMTRKTCVFVIIVYIILINILSKKTVQLD